MKMGFNSDGDLPLKKALGLHNIITVVKLFSMIATNTIYKFS